MNMSFYVYPVLRFNKADFYNRFLLEVAAPSMTALWHGLLTGLCIGICIYIYIYERNDFVV